MGQRRILPTPGFQYPKMNHKQDGILSPWIVSTAQYAKQTDSFFMIKKKLHLHSAHKMAVENTTYPFPIRNTKKSTMEDVGLYNVYVYAYFFHL